jgi:hypothetical protein
VDIAAFIQVCGAASGPTVVVDGLFLLRPELRDPLDAVGASPGLGGGVTAPGADPGRGPLRLPGRGRAPLPDSIPPGQALYRQEADPGSRADVLVDNEDVTAPRVFRWRRPT